jgi:3-dehydroquinate synthase
VAVGLALDCTYSRLDGALSAEALERILGTLERAGLPTYVPELRSGPDGEGLFRGLDEFREHLGGRLTIMLLDAIGRGREVHAVDRDVYTRAIDLLHARSRCSEQRRARWPAAEGRAA